MHQTTCNYVFTTSTNTNFASTSRLWRFGYDKLGIDLTIGEMLYTHTYRNIGSVLYIRNVTFGLIVSGNIFKESVYTSGAIMIEGFLNTATYPILINQNSFSNNFVFGFGLSVVIYQSYRDISSLYKCTGVKVSSNTFSSNVGCQDTMGNFLLICTPVSFFKPGLSQPTSSLAFGSETYNFGVNVLLTKDIARMNLAMENVLQEMKGLTDSYTDSSTSVSIYRFNVEISGNTCSNNLAIVSNCFGVIGAPFLTFKLNILSSNIVPLLELYNQAIYASSGYNLLIGNNIAGGGPVSNEDTNTVSHESVPLLVRLVAKGLISNNTFSGNAAVSSPYQYMAAAITIDRMLGIENVTIDGCFFKDYTGFSSTYQALNEFFTGTTEFPLISYSINELSYSTRPYPSFAPQLVISNNQFNHINFGFKFSQIVSGNSIVRTSGFTSNPDVMAAYQIFESSVNTGTITGPNRNKFSLILREFFLTETTQNNLFGLVTFPFTISQGNYTTPFGSFDVIFSTNNLSFIFDTTSGFCFFNIRFFNLTIYNNVFSQITTPKTFPGQNTYTPPQTLALFCAFTDHLANINSQSSLNIPIIFNISVNTFSQIPSRIFTSEKMSNIKNYKSYFSYLTINSISVDKSTTGTIFDFSGDNLVSMNDISCINVSSYRGLFSLSQSSGSIFRLSLINSTSFGTNCFYISEATNPTTVSGFQCINVNLDISAFPSSYNYLSFSNSPPPSGIIVISSSNVVLDSVNASNIFSLIPGFFISKSSVNITNPNFFGFKPLYGLPLFGIFLYLPTSAAIVNIVNGTVFNNNCSLISNAGYGCLITSASGILTMNGVNFTNNSAIYNTLFLGNLSTLNFQNVLFANNIAYSGFPFYAQFGTGVFSNVSFISNVGIDSMMYLNAFSNFTLTGSLFQFNSASNLCKNIQFQDMKVINISSTVFQDFPTNVSANSTTKDSFILAFDSGFQISSSKFINGTSKYAALELVGPSQNAIMVNNTFENFTGNLNFDSSSSTIVLYNELTSINETLRNCTGGYFITSGIQNVIIINTSFYQISQSSLVFVGTQFINITKSNFTSTNTSGEFQGLVATDISSFYCSGSIFNGLRSLNSGAGISIIIPFDSVQTGSITISISNSTFKSCYSSSNGGGLYLSLNKLIALNGTMNGSNFIANTASIGGGFYYSSRYYKSVLNMTYTNINANTALRGGGGYYFSDMNPIHDGSVLINGNSAPYGPQIAAYPITLKERLVIKTPITFQNASAIANTTSQRLLQSNSNTSNLTTISNYGNTSDISLITGNLDNLKVNYSQLIKYFNDSSIVSDLISNLNGVEYPSSVGPSYLNALSTPLVSGNTQDNYLYLDLIDEFGQTVLLDSSSSLEISTPLSNVTLQSYGGFPATNGSFNLSSFVVNYWPNQNATLTFSTSAINIVPNRTYPFNFTPISLVASNVTFRNCKAGEQFTSDNLCSPCASQTFNSYPETKGQQCSVCLPYMNCKGDYKIGPVVGYWRLNSYSDKFVSCKANDACLGAVNSAGTKNGDTCSEIHPTDSTFCLTGWCDKKYQGNECADCAPGNGRYNQVYCVACSNNPSYYLIVVVILFVAIAVLVFIVKSALNKKRKDSESLEEKIADFDKGSILMKIMVNYFQMISIVSSFQFKWPGEVQQTFVIQNRIATSTSEVFSIDCILKGMGFSNNGGGGMRFVFQKLILMIVSPIILGFLSSIVWFFIFLKKYRSRIWEEKTRFKNYLTTTVIVLTFLLHTNIVKTTIETFRCSDLNRSSNSNYFMDNDPQVECWVGDHLKYSLAIALPGMLFWGFTFYSAFIIPLCLFLYIRKNKHRLYDSSFRTSFGFLYDGYEPEYYYWFSSLTQGILYSL